MAHHGFHGGMAHGDAGVSMHEGTTELDPATGRDRDDALREGDRRDRRAATPGAAWTSPSPTPAATWPRCARRGEQDADGNWFVTGQKIFITSGHGKYHFVDRAHREGRRPERPFAGLGGLSMFLVPRLRGRPDGSAQRLVTHRSHRGEARAPRLGDRGADLRARAGAARRQARRGLQARCSMLMNNARLGVGFESHRALRGGACAWRGPTRPSGASMGKTIDRHEMIADYLDEMEHRHPGPARAGDARARSTRRWRSKHALLGTLLPGARGREALRARRRGHRAAARGARRRCSSTWRAEKAVEMARRCLQIHGGVGYMQASTAPRSSCATRWSCRSTRAPARSRR